MGRICVGRSSTLIRFRSFLDSTQNTELIRWSDDGQSFIVLDEDEFARTLIPELFKHNNYASFVRQLNMYGFHKRVGLNANSMKAAEKKVKDPSVYWHEYFQRGRPELLWLIQKPASKSGGSKRKRDGIKTQDHGESDDEARRASPEADEASRPVPVRGQSQDLVTVPRSEVSTLRQEVQKLQRQQSVISKMIAQLKEQNEQFYRQATAFQALHDRHENSINAILTFLATFYNRSLDGTGPNMMNMFGNAIPQQNQQQGSVVDVGDVAEGSTESSNRLQRYRRQPLALLPPPAAAATSGQTLRPPGSAFTAPNSARTSVSPPNEATTPRNASAGARSSISTQPPPASVSPAIKDDAPTPDLLNSFPESDDMMSLINNVNANSGSPSNVTGNPAFDFNSALDHYQNANGNTPLTPQERDSVLSMIAGSQPGTNNALTSPNPPPMPSLDGLAQTKQQLDMLAKLQQEQDSKVADLAGRLQPLSPTGAIPGLPNAPSLSNDPNLYDDLGAPGAFDLNEFLNDNTNNNYFNFPTSGTGDSQNVDFATVDNANLNIDDTGLNWDFNTGNNDVFGEPQEQASSGRVESVSSEATSPATVKAESDRVEGETPPKRRKVGA